MVGINLELDSEANDIVEAWSQEEYKINNKRQTIINFIKEKGLPEKEEEEHIEKEEEEIEYARFD